ncbi:MAG: hypothetical protein DRO76_00555 [Candidatus Altiarchaeales archaeon]|nr:MAG: hypothetical protein DRO76_00555 [Candidatus Altiarchaeales archaeon]
MKMNSKTKIIIGILIMGIILIPGCIEEKINRDQCTKDSDCVPEQCCHPTSCVNKRFAPNCSGIMCTMVCQGPIDCGAGRCVCKDNKCVVESLRR